MNRYILIWFFLSTAVITACSKSGNSIDPGAGSGGSPHVFNQGDTIPPVIDIYTPVSDQIFSNGSVINITGKVTDNGGLYHGSIRITDDANNAIVKEQLYEIHGYQSYTFGVQHTSSVSSVANYTVKVSFDDHGVNVTTRTVKIRVNP
jgi:hypothetical protein